MNKEIRIVDEKRGIVQVTTLDERWYGKQVTDKKTGLPVVAWKPSITFITSSYPKGIGYIKWIADKGYDKAEEIKMEAGDRGTIVHHACETLMANGNVRMDQMFLDREGNERTLTPDEYYHVLTYGQWYESEGCPKPLKVEHTVESEKYGYAGTLDGLFQFKDHIGLVDIKTSKYIFPNHRLQLSALNQALLEQEGVKADKMYTIQTGYTFNKTQHFKMTEIEDQLPLFLATKEIWANEHASDKPLQRDYPLEITIALPKPIAGNGKTTTKNVEGNNAAV